jgi:heme/copper-type cytochrome/quinol oxidase subunit 2
MTVIIFLCVYVLSAYGVWSYTSAAHSKDGIYSNSEPSSNDVLLVFIPVGNTFLSIVGWVLYPPIKRKYKKAFDYNNFFKIKK